LSEVVVVVIVQIYIGVETCTELHFLKYKLMLNGISRYVDGRLANSAH